MNHPTALDYAEQVKNELGDLWIPFLYRNSILKVRTRSYDLENIKTRSGVSVQHTLLGVELQIGARRKLCPDLATARYLAVFARLGCQKVAIPYDITQISGYADLLESSWHRMLIL